MSNLTFKSRFLVLLGVITMCVTQVWGNPVKCTSTSDLVAGSTYYISGADTYSSTATVMGLSTGGNNFPVSTFGGTPCELTLGGDATNGWTFSYVDGSTTYYLDPTNTTSSNHLKRSTSVTNYGKFTISFINGAAVITSEGKDSRNIIRYNSSSSCYSCYSSGQGTVYLYKKASSGPTDATWSVEPASVTVKEGKSATATITTNYDGTLSVVSNATGTATASIEGKTITVNGVAEGSTTLLVTGAATSNYNAISKTIDVIVTANNRPVGEVFYESFDTNDGTGGNDSQWSGSIASNTIKKDNDGWVFENGYGAKECARFGAGSKLGTAQTPAVSGTGNFTLTFKAAAWNGNSESTTLKLSATNATLSASSVTLTKGEWNIYNVNITNATTGFTIKFEGNAESNSRFFLDEVSIVSAGPATYSASVAGGLENGSINLSTSEHTLTTLEGSETITINLTPNTGYEVGTVTVTKAGGGTVETSGTGNTRTFTMPTDNVTVSATFVAKKPTSFSLTSSEGYDITVGSTTTVSVSSWLPADLLEAQKGVTYSIKSGQESYASVNSSTGLVTTTAVCANCTIVATSQADGNITAEYVIHINAPNYFPNNKTIFIQGGQYGSAWNDGWSGKVWINKDGAGGSASFPVWMYDDGYKMFAFVVPATGDYNQLQLQRFDGDTYKGINGTVFQSNRGDKNVAISTSGSLGNDALAWNNDILHINLKGSINSWGDAIGELTDQMDGTFKYTISNYAATGTDPEFKLQDSYNHWWGNYNYVLTGTRMGSVYNIDAKVDFKQNGPSLYMTKTLVSATVSFDKNGRGDADPAAQAGIAAGGKVTAPTNPTATGYRVTGWYQNAECTGEAWNFATNTVDESITLYAKWADQTYDVKWWVNGSLVKTETYDNGTLLAIPHDVDTEISCGGKVFVGWCTQSDYNDAETAPTGMFTSASGTVTAAANYYAVFAKNSFEAINYAEDLTTGNYVIAAYYNKKDLAMGNSLNAQNKIEGTEVTVNDDDAIVSPSASLVWTITRNGDNVTLYNADVSKYLNIIADGMYGKLALQDASANYTFSVTDQGSGYLNSWIFNSVNISGQQIENYQGNFTSYSSQAALIYLYKQSYTNYVTECSAISTYSITYHCNGATSGCPSDVASGATALPDPLPSAPTKTGYSFDGWFTNEECTVAAVAGATLSANANLYAKWIPNSCTVNWSVNGEIVSTVAVNYDDKVTELPENPDVICGGKVFVGWRAEAIAGEQDAIPSGLFTDVEGSPAIAGNTTFYAVFALAQSGGATTTTIVTSIADYAGGNSWINATQYSSVAMNSDITAMASIGTNTGKYYTSDKTWRFYQNEGGTLTIESSSGDISSVTLTFKNDDDGTISYNSSILTSATAVAVSGKNVSFTIGASSGSKGKILIQAISVTYAASGTSYSKYATTCLYPIRYDCATTGEATVRSAKGATINIVADPEEEGYEFRGWTVTTDGGDDVTVNGTSNNYSFTMPADGVTISCNMMAVYTATWSSASGDPQEVSYPADQAVDPATPTECSTKTFMGWSIAPITELQQSAPAMIDFPVNLSANTTYYAVYASKNGGKVTGNDLKVTDNISSLTYDSSDKLCEFANATYRLNDNASPACVTVNYVGYCGFKLDASMPEAYVTTTNKIKDLKAVSFDYITNNSAISYGVYISNDNTNWTEITSDGVTLSSNTASTHNILVNTPLVGDYYVKIGVVYKAGSKYAVITAISYTTAQMGYWYSDYSTTCDQMANPTMSFANGGGTGSVDAITTPGWITLPEGSALTKNCDIFAGWQVTGVAGYAQTFQPGDKYMLNYNVTMTAQWTSHPCATGSLDATAAYITTTNGVAKKSVLYTLTITSIDGETVTPHITGTDAALFAVTDAVLDLASATKTYKFRVQYTPTSAGVKNTNAALTFTDAAGKPITDGSGNTLTMTLNGRSVADEIVLAAKVGDVWYSLPANMDMANTHIGLPITVDNAANPTTATTVSADAIYTLNALHNSSTSDVSRVRFASTLDSKALWGSASNNSIKNWATLTGDAKGDAYDWILTTSDLNSYTITNNRGSSTARNLSINNNHYWGLHGELIASADIRILAKGTVITYIPMTVTNWLDAGYTFTTSVEIPSYSSILVLYGGSEFTATMTGSGPYTFNIPGVDYDNHSGEALTVEWLDAGGTPVAMGVVNTPIFIKTTTGTLTDYDPEFLATTDVHVLNGGKLTVAANCTIKNLIVGGGGTVVHTAGTFSVYALSLEGGLDVANGTEYDMPRLYITSPAVFKSTQSTVNFDVTVDKRNYYPFSVPFEVAVSTINYVDPVLRDAAVYNKHFAIKTYDGDNRAKNGEDKNANWRLVQTTETLKPGVGYILTAVSVANYDSRIRIPMTIVNGWTADGERSTYDAVTRNAVEVTAYTGAAATSHQHHAGWNFVANPYLAAFAGSNIAGDQEYIKGKVIITGESSDPYGYDDTEVTYVSIPTYDFSEYVQTPMSTAVLAPEWGFFVQIGTSGTMTFANAGRQQVAPRYLMAETETPRKLETALVLTDKTDKSDRTGLIVSNRYSAAYEIGADLEKMFGSGYTLATYTIVGGTRLAYNAMSEAEAHQLIPVGYRAPEAGTYTFSLDVTDEMAAYFERLDLIDYETGELTNLLTNTYTFTTERTQSDSRFAINATIRKVPTGLDDGVPEVDDGVQKVIWREHFYIIDHNRVYDGTGSLVNIKK